jgi:hypothetical protein
MYAVRKKPSSLILTGTGKESKPKNQTGKGQKREVR